MMWASQSMITRRGWMMFSHDGICSSLEEAEDNIITLDFPPLLGVAAMPTRIVANYAELLQSPPERLADDKRC